MAALNPDQRNYLYILDAVRVGIHKPILAALYAVHNSPRLFDGETGLGIAPINRVPPDRVNTFAEQVQYAANTIRSITERLIAQGWKGNDLWDGNQGRYSDRFIQAIADGYSPPADDASSALLESCDSEELLRAYLDDIEIDYEGTQLPQNLAYLDRALLELVDRIPRYYQGVVHQRDALLEALRIWRKLDTQEQAISALFGRPSGFSSSSVDEVQIDRELVKFVQNISPYYSGYPHQREALLRLVQLWRQLDSREDAIRSLQESASAEINLNVVDPALIAFVQRVPQFYDGKGSQRNALTEAFRLWRQLDSRRTALIELGVNPDILSSKQLAPETAQDVARQLDRELIAFTRRIPGAYQETNGQREALIRLVQLWRSLGVREKAIQALLEDVKRINQARRGSPNEPPAPEPAPQPPRPDRWTPNNIQLHASIIPNSNFTWAEATRGGQRMPPNQTTVDAIVRIAQLAQQARDRIGRPFRVTSWYRPPDVNRRVGGASESRHVVGDAIDYYVDGLTGDQIYRALDPWWAGGLGRYTGSRSNLSHIDARGYRARWRH
ncbi:MAG: D-Ala-D-Ala carboxypeptidase family metallohydrolase [Elainellaceae cyanobacterium]